MKILCLCLPQGVQTNLGKWEGANGKPGFYHRGQRVIRQNVAVGWLIPQDHRWMLREAGSRHALIPPCGKRMVTASKRGTCQQVLNHFLSMPPVAVNCGIEADLQFVDGGELLVRSAGGTKSRFNWTTSGWHADQKTCSILSYLSQRPD